jgi:F-type H+-transporting ATPase subunit gamma
MANLREIRGRLKAVGNIKRITRTMQMIATSKFQAAARRALATKPYNQKIADLVGHLAAIAGSDAALSHPLLQAPATPTHRRLLLVLTSNRGLCGGYNANILRTAIAFMRDEHPDADFDLEAVGRKGIAYFRFTGHKVAATHSFADQPSYSDVARIAQDYIARFSEGQYDAIHVAHMQFISNARQTPTVTTLLPMQPPTAETHASQAIYDFSPEPAALLAELLPVTVTTQLYQAVNDALVSEHVARMVAMKAATDNADDMGRNLRRKFNRARQAQITTELNEVVSGAEALG